MFHQTIIPSEFTQKLFTIAQDIQRNAGTIVKDYVQQFAHLNLDTHSGGKKNDARTAYNPALDFIRFVCHVFALDRGLDLEVHTLKRNLLKLVNIGAFAPEAEFKVRHTKPGAC